MKLPPLSRLAPLAALLLLLLLGGCNVNQPAAGSGYQTPTIQHAAVGIVDQPCSSCHASTKPLAFAGEEHGGGQECAVCHIPKDDTDLTDWLTRQPFDHATKPASCLPCHVKERPTADADPKHPTAGDCVACHAFPVFKAP